MYGGIEVYLQALYNLYSIWKQMISSAPLSH